MNCLQVCEVFGPTIQGEGLQIGQPTMFVRFQGCDSRCSWCDSPYSWSIDQGFSATPKELLTHIKNLNANIKRVTLTGGNPLIQNTALMDEFITLLKTQGYSIALETQGTLYNDWVTACDKIAVSPKPNTYNQENLDKFSTLHSVFFKVVIFGQPDIKLAEELLRKYPNTPLVLQVGNIIGADTPQTLMQKYSKLVEETLNNQALQQVTAILPQLHVLAYGNKRGI